MGTLLCVKAQIREGVGKKSAAKLRKLGGIPAIIYGHKEEPLAVALDAHNFVEGLHHGHRLIEVQTGEKKETVFVKDLQYDYLGKRIIHADLVRVDVAETIKVMIPIELKGTAKGTHEGGVIEGHADRLEVECKATDVPEAIIVLVKDVGIGDTIHASDVELPPGVKLISEPSTVLVTCSVIVAVKTTEELEAEAPAAPEVISEVKKAEGAEGAEEAEEAKEKPKAKGPEQPR
jgi:large subunit ribosomal protein L25